MTKQYTNTREPGEFGDGVTVEKMTDEALVEKLRTVNIATAPYACPEAVDWCHEAADRLSALTACQQEVGRLREENEEWSRRYGALYEDAEKRTARNAELVKALESFPSDTDFANAEGFRQAVNSWWNITARAKIKEVRRNERD